MSLFDAFTRAPEEAPNESEPTALVSIPIDRVVPDPQNERKTFHQMENLTTSIRTHGIIEPPVVMPLPDGRYQLLTGHRRWSAAKTLSHETIDVIIRDDNEDDDPCDSRLKSLVSNLQREAVPPLELAKTLQSMLTETNGISTQRQLAAYLGKSESWVSDTLALLRLTPEHQEELRTSETKVSLDAISKIARVEDPENQEALLKQALNGAKSTAIRKEINKGHEPKTITSTEANAATKPKTCYHTTHNAVVIIQSKDAHDLDSRRQREALQEAFQQITHAD